MAVSAQIRNFDKLTATLKGIEADTKKAIKNTISDMRARAPGWVATEITNVYNIKKGEITPQSKNAKGPQKKAAGVSVKGETIDSLTLTYTGHMLTPTHFKMTPKQRPKPTKDDKGRTAKRAKPYTVSAEIKKGSRKVLGSGVFLGGNKGGGEIPFQRRGSTRTPIDAIKTVSVPQMVTADNVAPAISEKLSKGLEERFTHHMSRLGGK